MSDEQITPEVTDETANEVPVGEPQGEEIQIEGPRLEPWQKRRAKQVRHADLVKQVQELQETVANLDPGAAEVDDEANDEIVVALEELEKAVAELRESGGGDYKSMTAEQAKAGNSTKPMVVSPKVLNGLVTKIVEEKLGELTS